ncbi:hypothetical protein [Streptomyces sp. TLI_171]|uniref:hypothetical protein n=1 Tax=Streptomyces sp. TLI_171 TaxID=1938859 RepID=UPI00117F1B8B|nr:hypothetical protein [Streptomyces sp. TLI_171]
MANETDVVKHLLLDAADQAGPLEVSLERVTARVRGRRRVRTCVLGLAATCLAAGTVVSVHVMGGTASGPTDSPVSTSPVPVPSPTASACTATTPPSMQVLGDIRSCQYIGLTLETARLQAAEEHRDLWIVSVDGVGSETTYDFRISRVGVTVVDGRVVSAHVG